MTPTSEILNKAADLIETEGWFQVDGTNGGHCIVSAIGRSQEGFFACIDAVKAHLGLGFYDVLYDWNDAPGRTASEVIEVLRDAALIEQARETELAKVEVSA